MFNVYERDISPQRTIHISSRFTRQQLFLSDTQIRLLPTYAFLVPSPGVVIRAAWELAYRVA